ncbi:16S rRNA (uracil(1498)-N(3))-methyltransferase [Pollutimonas harenae]|uniref:Ribosomal RNA small subunit methyltransferase E n=1 Tax=Pollutimonas harenae TaxID=657015 RepID=A0A853GT07_9BURK|nr:16S rRNA (uracil(1498)-N(3))-methyltransferase [Pollutimonas harenae]NYT85297.1 16S rRNA (uracil(1498)-N(3))-methyltransferase [Pollutimonas harenae]TEA70404.1 16S rRNA (uracil(1498)-N(3))-methyltransferase [Pollutimonas harenae]
MAISRFYCATPLSPNTRIELPAALAHHAVRVLRLKAGSDIVLFDGQGGQYTANLEINGKQAHAQLGDHEPIEAELAGRITLVQGIPSGDKMDWVIEKAVELGASRVVPLAAQRSVLQLSGERLRKRLEHWRRISQAASEQCGRNRIMEVASPLSLQQFVVSSEAEPSSILFCHPGSARTLAQAAQDAGTALTLVVGPEGGWSDEELALIEKHHMTPVGFGARVLRTETAGLALIAAVSALRGWN